MTQNSKLSSQGRNLLIQGSIWSVAVVLITIAQLDMDGFSFFFLWLGWLILAAFGLALLFGCGQVLWEDRQRALPSLLPLVITTLFLFVWYQGGGIQWAEKEQRKIKRQQRWERFVATREKYEAIVANIGSGKIPHSGIIDGINYQCDTGNPRLVSFIEPGGILDNYTAIVYDPTDQVLKINAVKADFSNFNDPDLRPVKKLFGGDMVWAEALGNHWYRCGFT